MDPPASCKSKRASTWTRASAPPYPLLHRPRRMQVEAQCADFPMHQVNQRYRGRDRRRCALTGSAHQYCHQARQARQASRCHPPQLSASFRIPCFRSSILWHWPAISRDGVCSSWFAVDFSVGGQGRVCRAYGGAGLHRDRRCLDGSLLCVALEPQLPRPHRFSGVHFGICATGAPIKRSGRHVAATSGAFDTRPGVSAWRCRATSGSAPWQGLGRRWAGWRSGKTGRERGRGDHHLRVLPQLPR